MSKLKIRSNFWGFSPLDGIPYQDKQVEGDRGITAENMAKLQHTDFNGTTNESVSAAYSDVRL